MSLYPPTPRYAGPRPSGANARDALGSRWRHWCALVDSRRVSRAMLETRRAVSALETGGGFSPRRALVAPCWKHWRYHVALRRRAPLVAGGLVDHECVVVAWKHWRVFHRGRPVLHDACVADCWMRWRFEARDAAARREAKGDALARVIAARRLAAIRRIDDAKVREVRRENVAERRRRRRDEDWGFVDPPPLPVASSSPATSRAASDRTRRLERYGAYQNRPEDESDEHGYPRVMDLEKFSHTVLCWRRWRRNAANDFERRARRREREIAEEDESSASDDASDDAGRRPKAFGRPSDDRRKRVVGTGAPLTGPDLGGELARVARARPLPPPPPPEPSPPPESELRAARREKESLAAAVKAQALARGFLARRRYAVLRSDPRAITRGLRALFERGAETLRRDRETVEAAKAEWVRSERRLAAMRFRNDDARARMAAGLAELERLGVRAASGRGAVKAREAEVRRVRAERDRVWAPLREFKDPNAKPWPSFPDAEESFPGRSGRAPRDERPDPTSPLDAMLDGDEGPEAVSSSSPRGRSAG